METLTLGGIPIIYYFIILSLLLTKIPVVGKFFNIINTAIHELGHAIFSLILEGKVLKIELFHTSDGITVTQSRSKFNTFIVSLSGYPFSSLIAWFCFYLLGHHFVKELIIGLSVLFLMMLILWIRNLYGVIWVTLFCLINFGIIYYNNPPITELVALFYSTVILTESIVSSFTILYLSITNFNQAGDATLLRKTTGIPAFFWGILFAGFSGFIVWLIVDHFPIFFY